MNRSPHLRSVVSRKADILAMRNLQSPPSSSALSFAKKTLSDAAAAFSSRRVAFVVVFFSSACVRSNRCSTPGSVGRKKGAFSGGFGGSFGLLRCCRQKFQDTLKYIFEEYVLG